VKAPIEPAGYLEALKREIRAVDPGQPVSEVRTLGEVVDSSTARRRFNTLVIATFACIGLLLVAAGIFGTMSTFVAQRRHEIGVRMALGADDRKILRLVFVYVTRLAAAGIVVGTVGVLASTQVIESLLYSVSPMDPTILVGGAGFVVVVGLLGAMLPAAQAMRIDPSVVLRTD